jgi:hypothetical protein
MSRTEGYDAWSLRTTLRASTPSPRDSSGHIASPLVHGTREDPGLAERSRCELVDNGGQCVRLEGGDVVASWQPADVEIWVLGDDLG